MYFIRYSLLVLNNSIFVRVLSLFPDNVCSCKMRQEGNITFFLIVDQPVLFIYLFYETKHSLASSGRDVPVDPWI